METKLKELIEKYKQRIKDLEWSPMINREFIEDLQTLQEASKEMDNEWIKNLRAEKNIAMWYEEFRDRILSNLPKQRDKEVLLQEASKEEMDDNGVKKNSISQNTRNQPSWRIVVAIFLILWSLVWLNIFLSGDYNVSNLPQAKEVF